MGAQTLSMPEFSHILTDTAQSADAPTVYTYRTAADRRVELELIDALADVLVDLPTTARLRVVMEIKEGQMDCWMLLHGLNPEQHATFAQDFSALGATLRPCAVPTLPFDEDSLAVVRVREGGSVTCPGMTRDLTRWLIRHNHVAFLVFDFKPGSAAGLARYDLAFVMRDLCNASGAFAEHVQDVMDTPTSTYRKRAAGTFLNRLRNWTFPQRPGLDGCLGNIADLFPL